MIMDTPIRKMQKRNDYNRHKLLRKIKRQRQQRKEQDARIAEKELKRKLKLKQPRFVQGKDDVTDPKANVEYGDYFNSENQKYGCGKDSLIRFTGGSDGQNTFGGDVAKALGYSQAVQELANFGTQMLPIVGSYYDIKSAVNDPSLANISTAILTTAGDIFTLGTGGMALRLGLKAVKAAEKNKKALAAFRTAKALTPGTKNTKRAIQWAGETADEMRALQQKQKALNRVRNSTKAQIFTHATDAKDAYERIESAYKK